MFTNVLLNTPSGSTSQGAEIGNQDGDDDSTQELWEIVNEGIQYVGTFTAATRYRVNDLVKYGGSILRCTYGHTSGSSIDNPYFVTDYQEITFTIHGQTMSCMPLVML